MNQPINEVDINICNNKTTFLSQEELQQLDNKHIIILYNNNCFEINELVSYIINIQKNIDPYNKFQPIWRNNTELFNIINFPLLNTNDIELNHTDYNHLIIDKTLRFQLIETPLIQQHLYNIIDTNYLDLFTTYPILLNKLALLSIITLSDYENDFPNSIMGISNLNVELIQLLSIEERNTFYRIKHNYNTIQDIIQKSQDDANCIHGIGFILSSLYCYLYLQLLDTNQSIFIYKGFFHLDTISKETILYGHYIKPHNEICIMLYYPDLSFSNLPYNCGRIATYNIARNSYDFGTIAGFSSQNSKEIFHRIQTEYRNQLNDLIDTIIIENYDIDNTDLYHITELELQFELPENNLNIIEKIRKLLDEYGYETIINDNIKQIINHLYYELNYNESSFKLYDFISFTYDNQSLLGIILFKDKFNLRVYTNHKNRLNINIIQHSVCLLYTNIIDDFYNSNTILDYYLNLHRPYIIYNSILQYKLKDILDLELINIPINSSINTKFNKIEKFIFNEFGKDMNINYQEKVSYWKTSNFESIENRMNRITKDIISILKISPNITSIQEKYLHQVDLNVEELSNNEYNNNKETILKDIKNLEKSIDFNYDRNLLITKCIEIICHLNYKQQQDLKSHLPQYILNPIIDRFQTIIDKIIYSKLDETEMLSYYETYNDSIMVDLEHFILNEINGKQPNYSIGDYIKVVNTHNFYSNSNRVVISPLQFNIETLQYVYRTYQKQDPHRFINAKDIELIYPNVSSVSMGLNNQELYLQYELKHQQFQENEINFFVVENINTLSIEIECYQQYIDHNNNIDVLDLLYQLIDIVKQLENIQYLLEFETVFNYRNPIIGNVKNKLDLIQSDREKYKCLIEIFNHYQERNQLSKLQGYQRLCKTRLNHKCGLPCNNIIESNTGNPKCCQLHQQPTHGYITKNNEKNKKLHDEYSINYEIITEDGDIIPKFIKTNNKMLKKQQLLKKMKHRRQQFLTEYQVIYKKLQDNRIYTEHCQTIRNQEIEYYNQMIYQQLDSLKNTYDSLFTFYYKFMSQYHQFSLLLDHQLKKKIILIVQSRYDPNSAFDSDLDIGLKHILLQLTSFNIIYLKVPNLARLLIYLDSPFIYNNSIVHLIIMAHGNKDSILFNQKNMLNQTTLNKFYLKLQPKLSTNASIFLHSCQVGQGGITGNNIANQLSQLFQNHTIFAAENVVPRETLELLIAKDKDNELHIIYHTNDSNNTIHIFNSNPVIRKQLEDKRSQLLIQLNSDNNQTGSGVNSNKPIIWYYYIM